MCRADRIYKIDRFYRVTGLLFVVLTAVCGCSTKRVVMSEQVKVGYNDSLKLRGEAVESVREVRDSAAVWLSDEKCVEVVFKDSGGSVEVMSDGGVRLSGVRRVSGVVSESMDGWRSMSLRESDDSIYVENYWGGGYSYESESDDADRYWSVAWVVGVFVGVVGFVGFLGWVGGVGVVGGDKGK